MRGVDVGLRLLQLVVHRVVHRAHVPVLERVLRASVSEQQVLLGADLAVDQMLEGHIFDVTQSTVSEGTFFVSDMDKIVDESNKVLDGEGKKIATHKDDLFLK